MPRLSANQADRQFSQSGRPACGGSTLVFGTAPGAPASNRVTIPPPAHAEPGADRIRWENLANGLGDVSALRATQGAASLARFQIRGDRTDDLNRTIARFVDMPDGSADDSAGPELSDDWEQNGETITIQVPGLSRLVLAGPATANVATSDSTEPYGWVPGDDYAGGNIGLYANLCDCDLCNSSAVRLLFGGGVWLLGMEAN